MSRGGEFACEDDGRRIRPEASGSMKKRLSLLFGLLALILLCLLVLSGSAWRIWRQEQLNQAFIDAVKSRDVQEVRLLLRQGADVETPYQIQPKFSFQQYLKNRLRGKSSSATYSQPPLLVAIHGPLGASGWPPADRSLIQALLDGHANINATDSNGTTALMAAVVNGEQEAVRLLLEHGADTRPKDKDSTMTISQGGSTQTVPLTGRCALQYAFEMNENTEIMELLLDHGADVDVLDGDGQTPLIAAAGEGKVETVRLLMAHGADLHMRDNSGRTALMQAKNYPEIVRILKHAGAGQ